MKYTKLLVSGQLRLIRDNELNQFIPLDEKNKEYVAYLLWLAIPNTPDEEEIGE